MRKRILSIITALCLVASILSSFSVVVLAAGSGTVADPYLLYNYSDLAWFRNHVNSGNYGACAMLMSNIDMSGDGNWTPIAASSGYTGTFDGDGHTISGLKINTNSTANLGLFGVINGGTVKNVAVTAQYITNNYNMTETYTGTIGIPEGYCIISAGAHGNPFGYKSNSGNGYWDNGVWMNLWWNERASRTEYVNQNCDYDRVRYDYTYDYEQEEDEDDGEGGYTSWYYSHSDDMDDGYVDVNVTSWYAGYMNTATSTTQVVGYNASGAQSNTGGIVGLFQNGTIEYSSFNGTISSNYARAGGIAGYQTGGTISKCYSNGTVTGTYAGGLVGVADGGTVTNCYSTAYGNAYTKTATVYSQSGTVEDYVAYTRNSCHSSSAGYANDRKPSRVTNLSDITGGGTDYNGLKWHSSDGMPHGNSMDRRNESASNFRNFRAVDRKFDVVYHSYRFNGSLGVSYPTVHSGWTYGLVCALGNGATVTNSYFYNTSAVNRAFSNNNGRASNSKTLASGDAASGNCANLTTSSFRNESNFSGWNFSDVWTMSSSLGRPVLYNTAGSEGVEKPYAIVPTGNNAIITVQAEKDTTTPINLPDYIALSSGKSSAGKFTYTVTAGDDVASVSGDVMSVAAGILKGDYTVSLHGDDPTGLMDSFDATFTIHALKHVPVPEVIGGSVPYSRTRTLGDVAITDGWEWDDPTVCPVTDTDYGAHYTYDSADNASFYDFTAVKSSFPAAAYDSELPGVRLNLHTTITESDETPRSGVITVQNADTYEPLGGAELQIEDWHEFPDGNTTAADGTVSVTMTVGEHNVTVSRDNFQTKEFSVEYAANNSNTATLRLVPVRQTYTVPTVQTDTGETPENARVVAVRTTVGGAYAWEEEHGGNRVLVSSGGGAELAAGDYIFKSATSGYSTNDTIYATVSTDGTITFYEDENHETEITGSPVLTVTEINEPKYKVTINRVDDTNQYTADVTIVGVKPTKGAFGIKYDTSLFSLGVSDVVLDEAIELDTTPEAMYGKTWNNNGYYVFSWKTTDVYPDGLEAEVTDQHIATITFTLVGDSDLITYDTFGVMPWQDTAAYKDYMKTAPSGYVDVSSQYWRYCDDENDILSLGEGRLEASRAIVNGTDLGGFFQAENNVPDGDSMRQITADIMTLINYEIPINNSVIRFHALDRDDNSPLQNLNISLFDTSYSNLDTKGTDENGEATFAANTAGNDTTDFNYTASMAGYWPVPLSEFLTDRPVVHAKTGKVTDETVYLDKKIYHAAVVGAEDKQYLEIAPDNYYSGGRYAYNGRDFEFRARSARGFKITDYPSTAEVIIYDTDGVTVLKKVSDITADSATGVFTLKGENLDQRELSAVELGTLKNTANSGYEDWNGAQPDTADGYRSFNIVINFNDFEVEELEYTVEGMTNGLGHVTYAATPDGSVPQITDTTGMEVNDVESIAAKTIKKDGETPSNHLTGTFTFTGDEENYIVEKVYINGIEIDGYADLHEFSYSFGSVNSDNSIAVLFWDGETPSSDSLITLVVGEYGEVNVTSPDNMTGLTNTKHTFLNKDSVVFNTTPENDNYVLDSVVKELDGEQYNITMSANGGAYTVNKAAKKNVTVYVTFRNAKADASPTLFVKSYVNVGEGSISPAGIQIVRMYDSLEFNLAAITKGSWMAGGVTVSPYNDLSSGEKYNFDTLDKNNTYRFDSVTESIAVGANFVEKAYPVSGKVDLSQNSNVTQTDPKTGATLTFVRLDSNGNENLKVAKYVTTTTAKRKDATFTVDLPAGEWNVYVTKPGYITYVITDYEFDPSVSSNFGEGKTVVTYVGSTETGTTIALNDAANVKSGMRAGVSETIFNRADVDNNGLVEVRDITYVLKNFGKQMIKQSYSDFCENGSNMITVIPNS